MLSNFHTHTSFCDGKNTPEEVVISAISKGFLSLGFSAHGYTPFDLSYCMQNTDAYRTEILRLKEKYKKNIQIYLGVEEDAFAPTNREKYDYIIGSSHYIYKDGRYFSIDSSHDWFKKCLSLFDGDALALASQYYETFCDYINKRKPDIIGHFDLITKYDETEPLLLDNPEYKKIARGAALRALKSGSLFEVNTGAIARGYRRAPYPSEDLLHLLSENDAGIVLNSDSHSKDTLDFAFSETKRYLYDIGFRKLYTLFDGKFIKYDI